jgi:hypothetical protein
VLFLKNKTGCASKYQSPAVLSQSGLFEINERFVFVLVLKDAFCLNALFDVLFDLFSLAF